MVWHYMAVDAMAHEVKGVAFGRREDVVRRLQDEGLIIVELGVDWAASWKGILWQRSLPARDLSVFFKDLGNMLQAGLTLSHILGTFQGGVASSAIRTVCVPMKESLAQGKSLAQAMDETRFFPPLVLNVVRSGERSGQLVFSCGLLSEYYELMAALRGKVERALAYPAVILIFMGASLIYVSYVVVPPLITFLPPGAMDGALTQFMLGLSRVLREQGAILLLVVMMAAAIIVLCISVYRRVWDVLLEKIPFVGALRKDMEISLCFFDIFILLKSGIQLDVALRDAASGGSSLVRAKLKECADYLVSGHTFSQALGMSAYFPPTLVETVRIGEEIGSYADYCERVFWFYYRSFETRLGALVSMVQPVLLSVCATGVIVFALAFLKPIYANLTHIGVL
jgi:type II secretory pathway component PulF